MMTVEEIYDYLKDNKGFHSARQIANNLELNIRSVNRSLKGIATYDEIDCQYVHLVRNHKDKNVGLKTKKAWVYSYVKTRRRKNE